MTFKKGDSIKVLVVDDHEVVRQGLKTIISKHSDLSIAGEAENGNQALQILKQIKVDVVLLDFDMPEKNGLETLIELKRLYPDLPALILSISPEDHYGTRFLKAGASGYLEKSTATDQLINAIRKVFNGGKYISSALTDKLVANLNQGNEPFLHESLTDREFQIFLLLAKGEKLKEIASDLSLSINTISTYRSRILQKMDLKNNAEIIHYAIENDLLKQ